MNSFDKIVFVFHLVSTLILVGMIWFIQIVHFPLFRRVGRLRFPIYFQGSTTLAPMIVLPAAIVEIISGIVIAIRSPIMIRAELIWIGLFLLSVIWISTFTIQIPIYRNLKNGFQPKAFRRLLITNWIQTYSWSFRGIIVIFMLLGMFP